MKRLIILFITALMSQSCVIFLMDVLDPSRFTDYYDPEITSSSDTLSTKYGIIGEIPSIGDTCWFVIEYDYVPTKFEAKEARRPIRYTIEIEGMEPVEPTVITGWEVDEKDQELPFEIWYEETNYYCYTIHFVVPENLTENERTVKARISVADNYKLEKAEWGEWKTVLHLKQKGTK